MKLIQLMNLLHGKASIAEKHFNLVYSADMDITDSFSQQNGERYGSNFCDG